MAAGAATAGVVGAAVVVVAAGRTAVPGERGGRGCARLRGGRRAGTAREPSASQFDLPGGDARKAEGSVDGGAPRRESTGGGGEGFVRHFRVGRARSPRWQRRQGVSTPTQATGGQAGARGGKRAALLRNAVLTICAASLPTGTARETGTRVGRRLSRARPLARSSSGQSDRDRYTAGRGAARLAGVGQLVGLRPGPDARVDDARRADAGTSNTLTANTLRADRRPRASKELRVERGLQGDRAGLNIGRAGRRRDRGREHELSADSAGRLADGNRWGQA